MMLKMYAIRDNKADVFFTPFFSQNNATALRIFTDLANDQSTSIAKHPMDYELFEIGDFDDGSCVIDNHSPVSLGVAVHFVAKGPLGLFDEGEEAK